MIAPSTYCECPLAGHCSKHAVLKTHPEWQRCQGESQGVAETLAKKYRAAWERGAMPGQDSAVPATTKSIAAKSRFDPIPRPKERVGSELKRLLSWFGQHGSTGCGCTNHANLMDSKGADWCESHTDLIVSWLADEARKSKVLGFSLDMVPGFELTASGLVTLAIRNARNASVKLAQKFEGDADAPLETSPLNDATVKRTLLYFMFPLGGDHGWIWRRNIDQLAEYRQLFNGGIHITVAMGEHAKKPKQQTESEDVVIAYIRDAGFTDATLHIRKNKKTREAAHFAEMLSYAKSDDPNAVFCVAHAKGVTHQDPKSVVHRWTELEYQTVLGNWDAARVALESYGVAGSFKRYGDFKTTDNHRWHYSGTFYWARSASVFRRQWQRVDRQFFGMESWPGLQFRADEGACLFADNVGNLYDLSTLNRAEDAIHRDGMPSIPTPSEYRETLRRWGVV